MRRPTSTMSARSEDSSSFCPRPILVAAGSRAKEHAMRSVVERDGAIGKHVRAADRIALHLSAALRRGGSRPAREPLDDAVHDPPERTGHEEDENEDENEPQHYAPGFAAPPIAGCAARRLSSARFAAWPSGLSGAS